MENRIECNGSNQARMKMPLYSFHVSMSLYKQ